jgi:hypothetical protein
MNNTNYRPNSSSVVRPIPKSIFLLNDFKLLVERSVQLTEIGKRFKPRLYDHSDFIIPKLFAISKGWSIHDAAEHLNKRCKKDILRHRKIKPQKFTDNLRERRFIPHQTEIDKYFRRLTEKEVKTLFGSILDGINEYIYRHITKDRSWTVIADNTKYPYYGAIDATKHMRAPYLPGTKHAWFFQGISVISKDIHLFTDFHSLTKGVYRCKDIPDSIRWLQFSGLNVRKLLVDREFYRAALVDDLRKIGVSTLMPTKKYNWVKYRMHQFLIGKGSFISGTIFSQTAKKYPHQRGAIVRLVLIGHDGQSAFEVRDKFRNGILNFDEAMHNLAGFYTNLKPWKNKRSWARYLVREYKRRWNIETGFRMLNFMHIRFRSNQFTVVLSEMYMRGWIYNCWQVNMHECKRKNAFNRDMTFDGYLRNYSSLIEEEIVKNILKRV